MEASLLAGCGSRQNTAGQPEKEGKISISMYMWDRSMLKELSPWLEEKFPNIDFTFIQSYNTMEYYKDLLARGEEIPDIITCRRFSLNDAAPLAAHLMDLSQTEVAGTFYSSYLEVNRETGGAIRWLPMCQLAVSKTVEADEAKRKAVMEVLLAIFSEEGQKHVAAGTSVLSYNKEVKITLTEPLRYVQDCIDSNHLYMRLASTEVFAISQDVGHKMMTGEYDAQGAYADFNAQITDYTDPDAAEVLFTQKTASSNEFTDHGSQAASSMMNTLCAAFNDKIAIGFSPVASTSIYAGDYTLQQAKWVLTSRNAIYRGEYTGEEVWRFMDWPVNVKHQLFLAA